MGFTITGNETLLFITTDASKFPIYRSLHFFANWVIALHISSTSRLTFTKFS